MKRILTLVSLGAVLSLGAAAFQAQTTLQVPFSFKVGEHVLPAGTYSVHRVTNSGLLLLRSAEGQAFMVNAERAGAYHEQRSAHVMFRSAGGKEQILTELWTGNPGEGYLLRTAK
jgi:hypothetical protein